MTNMCQNSYINSEMKNKFRILFDPNSLLLFKVILQREKLLAK